MWAGAAGPYGDRGEGRDGRDVPEHRPAWAGSRSCRQTVSWAIDRGVPGRGRGGAAARRPNRSTSNRE